MRRSPASGAANPARNPAGSGAAGPCRWRSSGWCRTPETARRGPEARAARRPPGGCRPASRATVQLAGSGVDLLHEHRRAGLPARSTSNAAPHPGRRAGMGGLHGLLDVLRIVVAAADDDHVLEPAGDEQLAVLDEAEVAGPQEGPATAVASPAVGRRSARLSGAAPVAVGDRRAATQNLADVAGRAATSSRDRRCSTC